MRRPGILASLIALATCPWFCGSAHAGATLSAGAYELLNQRAAEGTARFYVYRDADSGLNHGFPSGFFGAVKKVAIDTACIDDAAAANGCSSDPLRLDERRGTVLRIKFAPQNPGVYSGIYLEEPQGFVSSHAGTGYDLTGAARILFSFRSPTGIEVQFGVAERLTPWTTLAKSRSYATGCIALRGSAAQVCPAGAALKLDLDFPAPLKSVHLLFTVVTNDQHAARGGVVLLDDIFYDPLPTRQQDAIGLPRSTETFGTIPARHAQSGPVRLPPDQVNRNIASIYEASLTIIALLARGSGEDVHNALAIADALAYALAHDNQGDPLPAGAHGSAGLHNAYKSGDLALLNGQGPGAGRAGEIQLAGFSIAPNAECGRDGYCLVLDGATGGNNAFAVLALLKAYGKTRQPRYLNAARNIGAWIDERLRDRTGTGFGGYFLGYPDDGRKKIPETGKSTENNADIFAAFTALGTVEQALGNASSAARWKARAKIAGDFVIAMLDRQRGCFYAGTVPPSVEAGPGIDPSGPRRGQDIVNRFDFLDYNSFSHLAMASSAQYRHAIDWSKVAACLGRFRSSVKAAGRTFAGYDLVRHPTYGPNGVAWEFTGQAALVIRSAGGDATATIDALRSARLRAPFADGKGMVAATLAAGDELPPRDQCLGTPFQCIPERVGLAATAWAIFAETGRNPFR